MLKWLCILLLGVAPAVFGQRTELDGLLAESRRLRERDDGAKVTRPDWINLKHALRDWIESRLPANLPALDREYRGLEAQLTAELQRAGAFETEKPSAEAGYVGLVRLSRPPEYPGALVVEASVTVPCGSDASIYVYRFTASARSRLLEADGARENGDGLSDIRFSAPDNSGSGLFYASWFAVQCASVWDVLDYRLFRIDARSEGAMPIFSGSHTYTLFDAQVKLTPGDLLLELQAEALGAGWRRTYVLHYRIGPDSVQRIDPVALQPQDFVHEWMIRPWDEMQPRSAAALEKWRRFLHADYVFGEYEFAQPCSERPGATQIGVALENIGEREMPQPLSVYFLVEDPGGYRYKMSEVSFNRQEGCPGETEATYDNPPSLFPKK
jgi:hypothetical protein